MTARLALVVDDHQANVDLLTFLLEEEGFTVVTAGSGAEALSRVEAAEERQFDLIVLDLAMPGMDGFDLADRLRHLAAAARAQIIAVTAHHDVAIRQRAMASGFAGYVTKPIDVDDFVTRVKAAIALGGQRDRTTPEREVE